MKSTENLASSSKAKAWFKELMADYYKGREGGTIVVFIEINGIEYIHHNPYEWDFIPREEIEIINGKQFLKSSYLLPLLERKYEILFKIPGNNRD
jgi:hypothetical protein